jgi:hypothetical protein
MGMFFLSGSLLAYTRISIVVFGIGAMAIGAIGLCRMGRVTLNANGVHYKSICRKRNVEFAWECVSEILVDGKCRDGERSEIITDSDTLAFCGPMGRLVVPGPKQWRGNERAQAIAFLNSTVKERRIEVRWNRFVSSMFSRE